MHAIEPWLHWLLPIGCGAGLLLGGIVLAGEIRASHRPLEQDEEVATGRMMVMLVSFGIVAVSALGLIAFAIGHS